MTITSTQTSQSWWPQQLLIGWLNLILTAPIIYLFVGLPLVLRQHGWSGTEIGLLQLAGLPAVLKFFLATPIDRWRLGVTNYNNWGILLGVLYALTLVLLGTNNLSSTPFGLLFALVMLASLLGTWVDVPVNALAIRILPESERIRAGAIRSIALSLGAIAGGGVMLVLQARLGWAWPFFIFAACIVPSILLLKRLRSVNSTPEHRSEQLPRAGVKEWLSYFRVSEHRVWAVLLLFYFPAIGAAWIYLKPLMLDHGFAQEQIAWTIGVLGGLVAAIASMLARYVIKVIGAKKALPLFAGLNFLVMIALTLVVSGELGKSALIAAGLALAVAMGASSGLLFGLMMNHARPHLTALDYGVQSSLFVASRTIAPMLAGILLDRLSYGGLLAVLSFMLGLVCLLAWYSRSRIFLHRDSAITSQS